MSEKDNRIDFDTYLHYCAVAVIAVITDYKSNLRFRRLLRI